MFRVGFITQCGLLVDYNEFCSIYPTFEYMPKLRVEHKQRIGRQMQIKKLDLYRFVKLGDGRKCVSLPRFSDHKIGVLHNRLTRGIDISERLDGTADPKLHQQECADYLMQHVYTSEQQDRGTAGCVFVMATGLGKTYVATTIIEQLAVKTLVVLPNKSNLSGWRDALISQLPKLVIGEYHGQNKCDGDVVLAVIDSCIASGCQLDWRSFGFVIYDEIHNYPTTSRAEIFWLAGARCLLGLTATPNERLDHMDAFYLAHVGPIIDASHILPNEPIIQWRGRVTVIEYRTSNPQPVPRNAAGWIDTVEALKQLSADPRRLRLVVELILRLHAEHDQLYVFAAHRAYLESIAGLLHESGIPGTMFMGGSSEEEKSQARESASIILTTYSFGKEGVSIPRMNALVFAQPMRNKMRQIIGRILRYGSDPTVERHIIDIVDVFSPLAKQFATRRAVYQEKGFAISGSHQN